MIHILRIIEFILRAFLFNILILLSFHFFPFTNDIFDQKCICKLNVTLEEAKQALDFMIQDLYERKEVNKQECYNPTNITWDQHPWECPKKPIDPVLIEDSETPSPPNTSSLLKTLK